MNPNFKPILLISLFLLSTIAAHPLHSNIKTRLKLDEDSSNCWDSLMQLQACTSEILLFFLNGETHLGHGCCLAIRTITGQCWPNLMDTIGFTAEEGDILEGYCIRDADDTKSAPPLPPKNRAVDDGKVVGQQIWRLG